MNPIRLFAAAARKVDKALLSSVKMRMLAASSEPRVAAVGDALTRLCSHRLVEEEARWIRSIEGIRSETEASTEKVQVPDFGAGTPADTRADDAMKQGVQCTEVIGDACRNYSKEPLWAELLFLLIRELRPKCCVEMGTCLGISAAYQAAALELNGDGHLFTMEGAPAFAAVAGSNWERLGLSKRVSVFVGPFHQTMGDVLDAAGQVDCCFIDGHHDEAATLEYFERVLPRLAPESLLIFDDIRWSPGMWRAWEKICQDRRAGFCVDLNKVGLCLTGVRAAGRVNLRLE